MKTPNAIDYRYLFKNQKNDTYIQETCFTFSVKERVINTKTLIHYNLVALFMNGTCALGLSRCSHLDSYDKNKGRSIARTRALKLLQNVVDDKPITARFHRIRRIIYIIPEIFNPIIRNKIKEYLK